MSHPLRFALNRMVAPRLSLEAFVDLAVKLGADAIEIRNDLKGIEIEDGTAPEAVADLCAAKGVQVLSINALYPFDVWNDERSAQATKLAQYARACGAKGLVLCPLNDRADPRNSAQRAAGLRTALTALAPILREHGILGFVEPLASKNARCASSARPLMQSRPSAGWMSTVWFMTLFITTTACWSGRLTFWAMPHRSNGCWTAAIRSICRSSRSPKVFMRCKTFRRRSRQAWRICHGPFRSVTDSISAVRPPRTPATSNKNKVRT